MNRVSIIYSQRAQLGACGAQHDLGCSVLCDCDRPRRKRVALWLAVFKVRSFLIDLLRFCGHRATRTSTCAPTVDSTVVRFVAVASGMWVRCAAVSEVAFFGTNRPSGLFIFTKSTIHACSATQNLGSVLCCDCVPCRNGWHVASVFKVRCF
jgi:hypothetical protein